jgi:nitrogen fixation-related uncharacterized protein
MWSRAWLQRRRTRSCYNTLLQELRAEDIDEYKNYMRMSKETFNMLLEMSKCNWTNELVNDLIVLVEEIEVIWNAKAKVYHDKNKRKEAILFFDIWTDLFQEHIKAIFTMCFYLQNILMILIPKTILIGYFPSKSINVFSKIGWSSIPSKFIKVRQSF